MTKSGNFSGTASDDRRGGVDTFGVSGGGFSEGRFSYRELAPRTELPILRKLESHLRLQERSSHCNALTNLFAWAHVLEFGSQNNRFGNIFHRFAHPPALLLNALIGIFLGQLRFGLQNSLSPFDELPCF